jgi:hypothetical protein
MQTDSVAESIPTFSGDVASVFIESLSGRIQWMRKLACSADVKLRGPKQWLPSQEGEDH